MKRVHTGRRRSGVAVLSRLRAKGYGETRPVAPNTKKDGSDNPAGRAKNRRVVISAHRG